MRKILMLICIIIGVFCLSQIIISLFDKHEGTSFYNSTLPSHNEDFLKDLKRDYKDVKGYIEIKGTNINYPIVQSTDNDYYLNHLPNGEKNKMGSIYLDYRNNDFEDENTIIYGHNMNDGTMFSELENYKKQDYYEKHQEYLIYTAKEKIKVKIVAAYIADAAKESLPINFQNKEKEKYINDIKKRNILNSQIEITDEKIITLCTCADTYDTSRLILIGIPT